MSPSGFFNQFSHHQDNENNTQILTENLVDDLIHSFMLEVNCRCSCFKCNKEKNFIILHLRCLPTHFITSDWDPVNTKLKILKFFSNFYN